MYEPVKYSLWLQPSGDVAYRLQECIKKLSKKYETPMFEPHVTLLGGLKKTEAALFSVVDTLATTIKPFELHLSRADYRDHYYQSLFIHAKGKGLTELRNTACRMFDINEDNYMPHLSLLYGDFSSKEKERILNLVGREFHLRFTVNGIVVMETEGKPDRWKKVHTAAFKPA